MVYLRDLAQGLVQDAPQTPGGSTEGAERLQEQAKGTENEYDGVTDKVRSRVMIRQREAALLNFRGQTNHRVFFLYHLTH